MPCNYIYIYVVYLQYNIWIPWDKHESVFQMTSKHRECEKNIASTGVLGVQSG